jgi:hypothetical protein
MPHFYQAKFIVNTNLHSNFVHIADVCEFRGDLCLLPQKHIAAACEMLGRKLWSRCDFARRSEIRFTQFEYCSFRRDSNRKFQLTCGCFWNVRSVTGPFKWRKRGALRVGLLLVGRPPFVFSEWVAKYFTKLHHALFSGPIYQLTTGDQSRTIEFQFGGNVVSFHKLTKQFNQYSSKVFEVHKIRVP